MHLQMRCVGLDYGTLIKEAPPTLGPRFLPVSHQGGSAPQGDIFVPVRVFRLRTLTCKTVARREVHHALTSRCFSSIERVGIEVREKEELDL